MSPLIIGSGPNGLTTAFYLARAGLKPVVLERRGVVGGAAVTEEFAPGFRSPVAHATGPLRPHVLRDLQFGSRVQFVRPDPRLIALGRDGAVLRFAVDNARTADAIRPFSTQDAARYPEFCTTLARLGGFLERLVDVTPPSVSGPRPSELWGMLKIGRRFRGLGRRDGFRLLRWLPMSAADLVGEWFSSDLLQGAIAARGVFGTSQGPRSAGTGAALLLNAAFDSAPGGSSVLVKGGTGALTQAMADAARAAGAEIRLNAGVSRILVDHGQAAGVVLDDGSELPAQAVISSADPRRTFLHLVDPADLDPGFLTKVRNYRSTGAVAKVDIALNALPVVRGVTSASDLGGRLHVGPGIDYLERAFDASKYGEIPSDPYLDITIPSLHDTSLAPSGRHVMSVHVQFAPYKLSVQDWPAARGRLFKAVLDTLAEYAPDIGQLVEHQRVLTPLDLENDYGLTGGHILHGEPSLDQLFTMRPILGFAQYRTPIDGLFLCGAGTHPGGGITGAPGYNAAREILKFTTRHGLGRK